MKRKRLHLLAAGMSLVSILTFSGCEDSGDSGDPSTPVTGKWKISINYEGPGISRYIETEGVINENNGQLSGIVTGLHDGQDVSFTFSNTAPAPLGGETTTYNCSGTYSGNSMSGTCEVFISGNHVASGNWRGSRK